MASNIVFVCAALIALLPVPLIGLLYLDAIKLLLEALHEKKFPLPAFLIPTH